MQLAQTFKRETKTAFFFLNAWLNDIFHVESLIASCHPSKEKAILKLIFSNDMIDIEAINKHNESSFYSDIFSPH